MQTKVERFAQWRGDKTAGEQKYINTAVLIDQYVDSIIKKTNAFEQIQDDFSTLQSPGYKGLAKYKARTLGSLVYCKLVLDEIIEKIPVSDSSNEERELLINLNNTLTSLYDDPSAESQSKVDSLQDNIKLLLKMSPEEHADKEEIRLLILALQTTLNILSLKINNLSFTERTIITAASAGSLLNNFKAAIPDLLVKIEEKITILDVALQESNQNATVSKTIQDHFNERYLKILDVQQTEHDKVNGLKVGISEIISGIKGLITANNTKSELISSIKQLETLLKTAEDNDKAVTGRKYFGELVASNQEAYDALLIASDGTKKNKLESNILALKNQGISGAVLYAASWAASLIAVTYRYTAPQIVQNSVIALTPETADSACKNGLKDLAKEHLTNLKNQLKATELDITTVTNILSGEHDALKQLLRAESPENLTLLLDANNTTKEALEHYSELSESLQEKRVKLNNIKETHTELDQFIMKNDTFAVKLSNILANISTWFKSDAAEMVDNAKQIKQELFFFEAIYLSAIDKNLSDIKTNPELNEDIKTKLRDAFHPMTTQTPQAGEPGVSTIEEFQAFRMKFQNQIVDSSRHGFFAYEPGADKQQPVYSTIGSCPEFTLR